MKRLYRALAVLLLLPLLYSTAVALTLEEVIKYTLETNPNLVAARQQVLSRQ